MKKTPLTQMHLNRCQFCVYVNFIVFCKMWFSNWSELLVSLLKHNFGFDFFGIEWLLFWNLSRFSITRRLHLYWAISENCCILLMLRRLACPSYCFMTTRNNFQKHFALFITKLNETCINIRKNFTKLALYLLLQHKQLKISEKKTQTATNKKVYNYRHFPNCSLSRIKIYILILFHVYY